MRMIQKAVPVIVVFLFVGLIVAGAGVSGTPVLAEKGAGMDMKMVEQGRYLVQIAGCNDCHTAGYLLSDGKIPEEKWLTGDNFGWRGPWGTTYGSNLRLFFKGFANGDEWVSAARELKRRPPMPWYTVNIMKEEDLMALYHYIRYMGPAGEPAPSYVPPGQEPQPPYALFPSPPVE